MNSLLHPKKCYLDSLVTRKAKEVRKVLVASGFGKKESPVRVL